MAMGSKMSNRTIAKTRPMGPTSTMLLNRKLNRLPGVTRDVDVVRVLADSDTQFLSLPAMMILDVVLLSLLDTGVYSCGNFSFISAMLDLV